MGMPRGLIRSTHYFSTVEAWRDWKRLAECARADGYAHLVVQFQPREKAGHHSIDKATAGLRSAMNSERG